MISPENFLAKKWVMKGKPESIISIKKLPEQIVATLGDCFNKKDKHPH